MVHYYLMILLCDENMCIVFMAKYIGNTSEKDRVHNI